MTARSSTIITLLGLVLFAQAAAARDPWVARPAYGNELMTRAEIDEYKSSMKARETHEEKLAFWRQHVERMQLRSEEWGVQLADPPKYRAPGEKPVRKSKAPYFEAIMTPEEVDDYHATLAGLDGQPDAKNAYIADHVVRMRRRGFERGISVPGTFDWNYVFESGAPPPDVIP